MFQGQAKVHAAVMAFVVVVGALGVSAAKNQPQVDWTHYVNARWGFCVDYPAQWKANVLGDGSGVRLYPDTSADPNRGPSVSISALPDQPDVDNANIVLDDSPPLDLEGNFARTLENVRMYDHASNVRVLEKRRLEFQGFEALKTKFVYWVGARHRAGAVEWADETLWINKEYIIFTATLFGQPNEVRGLEPDYRDIVTHRFRLVCPAAR